MKRRYKKMIKSTNVQKTVIMPKVVAEMLKKEAKENFCSESTMIKNILISYYKNKEKVKCN